jgi:hypothetical protein
MPARDRISDRVPEWRLQAEAVAGLDALISQGLPFAYAASLEGVIGNLNPYQARLAKATGVKRGEPDLRIYLPAGRLLMIELKGKDGRLSPDQKERIPVLQALGFAVQVIKAETPEAMREAVTAAVKAALNG